ncbi:MAG: DNA adenine methylase [Phycisphaerae bacterium]|nr:DNA adenine methylase [Phycisphaerae bacterium]
MATDTNIPKIKAIAPWFGGKRTMAPRIVAELGEHRSYWEPFCGSMAVLLGKPKSTSETVNDLNNDLINLACVIRDPYLAPELYRHLKRTLCHESLFRQATESVKRYKTNGTTPDPLLWAYYYFIASWLGRNGVTGTQSYNQGFCARYTQNGGHAAKRWASAIDSIPAWRRRMREVTILCKDGLELIGKIADEGGTAIYVDPPYLTKGAKYIHDFEAEDHARLSVLLWRFKKARVVVSYYDDPRLDEFYPTEKWKGKTNITDRIDKLEGVEKTFFKDGKLTVYYDETDSKDAVSIRIQKELANSRLPDSVDEIVAISTEKGTFTKPAHSPPRWTKVKCYRHKALSTQNKRGGTADVAPEVLLINGPSYTDKKTEGGMFE